MAQAVVTGILGKFGQFLFDPIKSEFDYLFCFDINIQKLQTQLRDLKATREGVQLWVVEARNNLRSVPEADTWLIEANNKIAEAAAIIESEARVQTGCLNGWCGPRYSLSRKAANITPYLVHLHTEGIRYTQLSHSPPPPSTQSPPSTGFEEYQSRNLIVKQIIDALKDDEINLVGLCGMGGVGKTTMVKHVAKRVEEEKLFNEVAMAVVSQEQNLKQVQSCIADMLDLKLHDRESPIVRASLLRKRLLLDNKKILVILDDIWEEFDLEELGFPLEGGNKSCKILFTSRIQNLWKGIQKKRYIPLEVLVGEEPWHLFREKVGDCADDLDLQPLVEQIVNECGGLPLALVTIGRALTNEHNQRHWNNVLQQLRTPCSESLSSKVPAKVYQALYLSYSFLKDERAKKLFLRCCLFPEDYNIPIEDLVRYGIGLRWFEGINEVDEVRDRVNILVDQLKSCCLLLDGNAEDRIKMHDVVRHVAISIAAKDKHGFMTIHGAKSREWPKKATYELNTSISVISDEIAEFPGGLRCSKLEFLLIQCHNYSLKIPSNFFEGMGKLKVLDLAIREDILQLPSSLQFLSNLLTLHLDKCQKFDNISIIGKLLNLEILSFRDSHIEELPEEIGGLVNLKLLDLTRCRELGRIAPGVISALVQLQELYLVDHGLWKLEGEEGGENASLREFESLSNLNTLVINIHNVACLPTRSFGKLKHLTIQDCNRMEEVIWKEKGEDDATNKMEFPALESMTLWSLPMLIGFCRGTDEIEFPQLKELCLWNLPQLKWLFLNSSNPFSESMENKKATFLSLFPHKVALPSLEELQLRDLDNLEGLGHIPISEGSFSKLRKVVVENSSKLLCVFPSQFLMRLQNLEDLIVKNCSLLKKVFELEVVDCNEQQSKMLSLLKSLKLKHLPQLDYISESDPIGLMYIPKLSILHIDDVDNLRFLFSQSMTQCILQLQELKIKGCKMMSTIVREEDSHGEILVDNIEFTQLKILRLYDLQNLVSIFPKVTTTVAGQSLFNEKVAFPSLEELELHGFQNMNEIWCNQLQTGSFNKLIKLYVSDCGSLRNMFSPFMARHLVHLKRLVINKCSMMEEVVAEEDEEEEGRINRTPLPKLEYLKLEDLPELKSFCHVTHDWELPSVDDVTVLNCPKMKTFSHGVICTPKLLRVFVKQREYTWCLGREGEHWLWISDLNQTILHLIEKEKMW